MVKQVELAGWLSAPAPAHHLRSAFTALAGTNIAPNLHFLRTARRYRNELIRVFKEKGYFDENIYTYFTRRSIEEINSEENWIKRRDEIVSRVRSGEGISNVVDVRLWGSLPADTVPQFTYKGIEIQFDIALWPMAVLLFMVAAVFVAGFVAFTRYDVR